MTERFLVNWTVCSSSQIPATETRWEQSSEHVQCSLTWPLTFLRTSELQMIPHSSRLSPRRYLYQSSHCSVSSSWTVQIHLLPCAWSRLGPCSSLPSGYHLVLLCFALWKNCYHPFVRDTKCTSTITIFRSAWDLILRFFPLSLVTVTR